MLNMSISMAKSNFFDRSAVITRMKKATMRNLSKFGAYVRTRARTSLRYRDKPSMPGQPPHAHKTMRRTKTSKKGKVSTQSVSPLRDFLFFAADQSRTSVVIGPARLSGRLGDAPSALEYGGSSVVRAPGGGTRTVQIAARPFMRPAFEDTKDKLPEIWRNSLQGG